mgnify:FL=1
MGTDKPERVFTFHVRISVPVDVHKPTTIAGPVEVTARTKAVAQAKCITLCRRALKASTFTVTAYKN